MRTRTPTTRRRSCLAPAALFALVAACGGPRAPDAPAGQVRLAPTASIVDSVDGGAICAHFTLQPYAPAADGTPALAGPPISFNSSAAAGATGQLAGCVEGDDDAAGYNWGYIVTVDTFSDCSDTPGALGAPLADVYPSRTTLDVPVHCVRGQDSQAAIEVSLAASSADSSGYVDISAGVDSAGVQVGCKQAEIAASDGMLHFGESYFSSGGAPAPGLVALDRGAPAQFGGAILGSDGQLDTFYTGDIDPQSVGTLYQTFLSPCAAGEELAERNHAQCISDASGAPAGTTAELADAFAFLPGVGFAAVSISGGALQIDSSTGSTTLDAAQSPFAPGFNTLEVSTVPPCVSGPCGTLLTGVFVDQGAPLQFLVAAIDASGAPVFAKLARAGGAWALGSFAAPIAAVIGCNGLYAAAPGCFIPKGCSEGQRRRSSSGSPD